MLEAFSNGLGRTKPSTWQLVTEVGSPRSASWWVYPVRNRDDHHRIFTIFIIVLYFHIQFNIWLPIRPKVLRCCVELFSIRSCWNPGYSSAEQAQIFPSGNPTRSLNTRRWFDVNELYNVDPNVTEIMLVSSGSRAKSVRRFLTFCFGALRNAPETSSIFFLEVQVPN